MPKELQPITRFGLGMVTSIDPQDIPLESAIYSENLDSNAFGRLQGILANSLKSSTVGEDAVGINSWLRRESGEHDLIYTDGTNIKSIRDFYGTPTENTEIASKVPTSMAVLNQSIHMGTGSAATNKPQFLGSTTNSFFGGLGIVIYTDGGGGLNDLTAKGYYSGSANTSYFVEIDGTPGTDTFQWKKDTAYGGAGTWTTDVPITGTFQGNAQELDEGVYVFFGATSGHAIGDIWEIPCTIATVNEHKGDAELLVYEDTTTPTDPPAGYFGFNFVTASAGAILRRYKYSLIYDGIQESLLSTVEHDRFVTNDYDTIEGYIVAGEVISSPNSWNKRITGLNLYQATSLDGTASGLGQYRLVQSFLIGNGDLWYGGDNKIVAWTDENLVSVSYEQNSGILENADVNLPNYELSCVLNNFHFVAKCWVQQIPDAKMMLFRSTEFCYDVFDIYNDKVPLNILPTGMAGFNNKIYVWDSNTTIIINASNLSIENIIHGTGCSSPLSWTIIDTLLDDKPYRALVFADSHDIYMDEGAGARPISDAIRTRISSGTVGWANMQHSSMNPILVFDAPKNTLLCISSINYAGNIASVFAYNITSKRWDYYPDFCNYSATSRLCKSAFSGKDGETYCVNGFQVLNNFGNTTNRAWKYYSPELVFGAPKQPKMWYNFYLDKVETSGTITPTYSVNKGSSYSALTNTTEIKTGSAWEKTNSIILALSATAGVNYVNAIELLYRKMVGVR